MAGLKSTCTCRFIAYRTLRDAHPLDRHYLCAELLVNWACSIYHEPSIDNCVLSTTTVSRNCHTVAAKLRRHDFVTLHVLSTLEYVVSVL